ncbi:glycoside hydrolase family 88 protein [Marinilongibacter aquaticus]|uniref:glycoside hydrolase family 88 protein n=1 Tax=Marinilongibacter aquaticus TaxID=2975157 RepID=UPI0021BDE48C|nr:glycoside hydrolase family 88 protein [Marinilongibacter aquaticus]UBM58960.1 glycoside hydrolase family 88 protein [Marinilongibacter aquaticus]
MKINNSLKAKDLQPKLTQFWELSAQKIRSIEEKYDDSKGAPVFTVNGQYTSRGWTEWTEGFRYGSAILQFEATGEEEFLSIGKDKTLNQMAPHLTHIGVHDHGFNNISTYGNLLRLMLEGQIEFDAWEKNFYELAIKNSAAVQASRWTTIKEGGYIYSFNGPHSLFVDTIRSVRILMLGHLLGHKLKGENDKNINLLERGVQHIQATAKYNVYYGEGRDNYDLRGRTAHECIFNTNDGNFRAPNAQQGFSGFTTWTRGLAWAICGFAEELELVQKIDESEFNFGISKGQVLAILEKGAQATCDFYMAHSALDGITYWDTGAPQLYQLGDYTQKPAAPYNAYEPVDSTASAIAAQGFIRLGNYLNDNKYLSAGLSIADTLFSAPYLSVDPEHQGILLHSIYHWPNGWDNIPEGQKIACEESSMWGDYHIRELAIQIGRLAEGKSPYAFFNCLEKYRNL